MATAVITHHTDPVAPMFPHRHATLDMRLFLVVRALPLPFPPRARRVHQCPPAVAPSDVLPCRRLLLSLSSLSSDIAASFTIYRPIQRLPPLSKVGWVEKFTGSVCVSVSAKQMGINGIDDS